MGWEVGRANMGVRGGEGKPWDERWRGWTMGWEARQNSKAGEQFGGTEHQRQYGEAVKTWGETIKRTPNSQSSLGTEESEILLILGLIGLVLRTEFSKCLKVWVQSQGLILIRPGTAYDQVNEREKNAPEKSWKQRLISKNKYYLITYRFNAGKY